MGMSEDFNLDGIMDGLADYLATATEERAGTKKALRRQCRWPIDVEDEARH
jgi:hypothetical protein